MLCTCPAHAPGYYDTNDPAPARARLFVIDALILSFAPSFENNALRRRQLPQHHPQRTFFEHFLQDGALSRTPSANNSKGRMGTFANTTWSISPSHFSRACGKPTKSKLAKKSLRMFCAPWFRAFSSATSSTMQRWWKGSFLSTCPYERVQAVTWRCIHCVDPS